MENEHAAAGSDPPQAVHASGPRSDQDTDIEAAVAWLAEHYSMSDRYARILLGQAAQQDRTTELEASRRLLDDLRDPAHRSRG